MNTEKEMLNFTVGPVQSSELVRNIGYEQVPYFRTPEFSSVMLENERLMKKFTHATDSSKVVFITGSGTASMEACVINFFTKADKVLIVNGGSFGQRFVDICEIHKIPYTEIKLQYGDIVTKEILAQYQGDGYTGFLVNIHETSTGVLYDIQAISDFCKQNGVFLLVDAISSFLADPVDMQKYKIGALITGSQKALACAPGISVIVLSEEALERAERIDPACLYLNLKRALKDAQRGQTPFTPAVGILRQINARLKEIEENGGAEKEIERTAKLAADFRKKVKELPFEFVSKSPSNAVTPLHPVHGSAYEIFRILKDEYKIWVCPNGGDMAEKIFRVGHIGCLAPEDNDTLICALKDMQKRGLL